MVENMLLCITNTWKICIWATVIMRRQMLWMQALSMVLWTDKVQALRRVLSAIRSAMVCPIPLFHRNFYPLKMMVIPLQQK